MEPKHKIYGTKDTGKIYKPHSIYVYYIRNFMSHKTKQNRADISKRNLLLYGKITFIT